MCHISCVIFIAKYLSKDEVMGKRVLEVGSYDVNGTVRPLILHWNPAEYVGVDIENGPGVDVVCNAANIVDKFGKESFDIVISTELLEHVRDWRRVISNIKNVCAPGGIIVITTRSYGFGVHGYPYDFWRYQLEDMRELFSDCSSLLVEQDSEKPGVFVKAKKPTVFFEKDLSGYKLYSMIARKRLIELSNGQMRSLSYFLLAFRGRLKNLMFTVGRYVHSKV